MTDSDIVGKGTIARRDRVIERSQKPAFDDADEASADDTPADDTPTDEEAAADRPETAQDNQEKEAE